MIAVPAIQSMVADRIKELRDLLRVAQAHYRLGHPSIRELQTKIGQLESEQQVMSAAVAGFVREAA